MKFDVNDVYAVQLSPALNKNNHLYRIFVKMHRKNKYGHQYSLVNRMNKFYDTIYSVGKVEMEEDVDFCLGKFLAERGINETQIDLKVLEEMDQILCGPYMSKAVKEKRVGSIYAEFIDEVISGANISNTIANL